ncbi:MAG: hypothetical protein ACOX5Z_06365 [Desulfobulbus sp.]|jgi:hypothetical protein
MREQAIEAGLGGKWAEFRRDAPACSLARPASLGPEERNGKFVFPFNYINEIWRGRLLFPCFFPCHMAGLEKGQNNFHWHETCFI